MTALSQVPPRPTASVETNSAGDLRRTHDTDKVACRLYSRIVGNPANECTGADASTLSKPVRNNSNASDDTAAACADTARSSEQGVGGHSCQSLDPHAAFNPEAAPMARVDALTEEKRKDQRRLDRSVLLVDLFVCALVAGAILYLGIMAPYHEPMPMPISCFATGC